MEEHGLKVVENRVLRGIFGPKKDEVTGEWRKLHNEELHDLYSSPSMIRIIKSMRIRWENHVARMGRRGTRIDYWRGRDHSEDQDVGGWIILGWILQMWDGDVDWIGLAKDRNRWRALVNSVLNLRVP
jgi:hypothetical protein